ncbi:MAG: hypothetical protein AMK72_01075, partial [Planctomycetes bacterium SM23_25]
DSIFFRAADGTVRYLPEAGRTEHIAPMRPSCHSGVIVSNGLLYWGPWICGCRLSLFGHVCLGPAGTFDFRPPAGESRLQVGRGDLAMVKELAQGPDDRPAHQPAPTKTNTLPPVTHVPAQAAGKVLWTWQAPGGASAAPVVVGGMVFIGCDDGAVCALDVANGGLKWTAYTGGQIKSPPAVWNGRLYVGSGDGWVYAFEAVTGRQLWRFRPGPAQRWIPVYGRLQSTWPVAGGVVVAGGTVYAAAGIAHYDGTYVVALDAVTGQCKWLNDSSGQIGPANNGVSLQGPLWLDAGSGILRFAGGNVHPTAGYETATGKCLNPPAGLRTATRTLFYLPGYPPAAPVGLAGGRNLVLDARAGVLSMIQTQKAGENRSEPAALQSGSTTTVATVKRGNVLMP